MPFPFAAAGIALSLVDIGFNFIPDPDIEALDEKLTELQASLDELGTALLDELDVVRNLQIDTSIAEADTIAQTAYDSLLLWRRQENPSEQLTQDTIIAAQNGLNAVLDQVEAALAGAEPGQAVGFIGSIAYALNVRMQVAIELEGGAIGTESIARSLQEAGDAYMAIHAQMPGVIEDEVKTSSSQSASYSAGDYFLGVPTSLVLTMSETVTVRSDITGETKTKTFTWSDKITGFDVAGIFNILINAVDIFNVISGYVPKPSSVSSSIGSFVSDSTGQIVAHDMEELGFNDLPEVADHYYDLSDGEEVVGTNGDDGELRGTAGNDLVVGKGGDDWMRGLGDHDVLRGGSGDDNMHGGADNDRVEGEDGRDRVKGGGGEDALYGGEGNDRLYGDGSSDYLEGGGGADRLYGGANRDVLIGGDGQDRLEGGDGKDTLEGGQGHDEFVLDGANPDVILDFGFGNDTITLDGAFFAALGRGQISADEFVEPHEALGSGPKVIYQGGNLLYDADGRGSGEAVKIAELEGNPDLSHLDIFVA